VGSRLPNPLKNGEFFSHIEKLTALTSMEATGHRVWDSPEKVSTQRKCTLASCQLGGWSARPYDGGDPEQGCAGGRDRQLGGPSERPATDLPRPAFYRTERGGSARPLPRPQPEPKSGRVCLPLPFAVANHINRSEACKEIERSFSSPWEIFFPFRPISWRPVESSVGTAPPVAGCRQQRVPSRVLVGPGNRVPSDWTGTLYIPPVKQLFISVIPNS
jgi:hypothetical protein